MSEFENENLNSFLMDGDSSRTIIVSGVPEQLKETLEVFVENKKKGGGDFERFDYDKEKGLALITFEDTEVATRFLENDFIAIQGQRMQVHKAPDSETIYIRDLPDNVDEVLECFLESPKKGGGAIDEFHIDPLTKIATVKFVDKSVANNLLKQKFIEIQGRKLSFSKLPPIFGLTSNNSSTEDGENEDEKDDEEIDEEENDEEEVSNEGSESFDPAATVLIENVPSEMVDFLEIFLDDENIGGGTISSFDHAENEDGILVTFENPEVAKNLLKAGSIQFGDTTLKVVSLRRDSISEVADSHGPPPSSIVTISGIPRSLTATTLKSFLANKKVGGGQILDLQLDEIQGCAVVQYQDLEVAQNLISAGKIQFKQTILNVLPASPPAAALDISVSSLSPEVSSTVEIRNIPESMTSETFSMLIENTKRSGGGKVKKLKFNQDDQIAVVTFEDPHVAENLLKDGKIQYNKILMTVCKPSQPAQSSAPKEASSKSDTIELTNIPSSVNEETLKMLLENKKRSGGGEITNVVFDQQGGKATVTFKDPQIASNMMQKGELKISDKIIKIHRPSQPAQSSALKEASSKFDTIELTNIPSSVNEETLKMLLENKKRSGGGEITNVVFDQQGGKATVTFKDPQIASSMLHKGELKISDKVMKIHKPTVRKSADDLEENLATNFRSLQVEPRIEPRTAEPRTVELRGHMKDIAGDQLELYLENKRSGGGPTEDIQILPDCAIVTFEKSEDAFRFAKKNGHVLSNVKFQVILLDSWPIIGGSCAIRVEGLKKGISTETILLFFENTKRSGGKPESIEDLVHDDNTQTAIITFQTSDVVQSIIKKGKLTLDGDTLKVEVLKPARPPPLLLTDDVDLKVLLFTEMGPIPPDTAELKKFAEKAGNAPVENISFCTKPGVALVQYRTIPDYDHVRKVLCSKPLHGQMISIQRIPVPTSVQIHNIGNLTEETLALYFESNRSGGGDIEKLELSPDKSCAKIEFKDHEVIKQVLARKHMLSNQILDVKPYIHCIGYVPPGFDCSRPFQANPPDIDVSCTIEIIGFIKKNKEIKKGIEWRMKQNHCFVSWPKKPR